MTQFYSGAYMLLLRAARCCDEIEGDDLQTTVMRMPDHFEHELKRHSDPKSTGMYLTIPFGMASCHPWFVHSRMRVYPSHDLSTAEFWVEPNTSEREDGEELYTKVMERCREIVKRMREAGLIVRYWEDL